MDKQIWDELRLQKTGAICVEIPARRDSGFLVSRLHLGDHAEAAVVFPGAFSPIHDGHRAMADIAHKRLGTPADFEISIVNVDKSPLDDVVPDHYLCHFQPGQRVWFTRAPTFEEKSKIFPNAVFVVGIDTICRIAEPVYYDNDPKKCIDSIGKISDRGCRFLVFGRARDDRFQSLKDIELPSELRSICDEVPEADFRVDVSSSELRGRNCHDASDMV